MSTATTRGVGRAVTATEIETMTRVCVKVPVVEPHSIEDEAEVFVPIFHEWIREGTLDLVALDVADYAHVPAGPGIMLICHEVNFAMDRSDGRFGLHAQRRIDFDGTAAEAVSTTLRQVLDVAARLERDPRVTGKLSFDASTIRVEANDRLRAPNTDQGYAAFAPVVEAGVAGVFGNSRATLSRAGGDLRNRLTVEVKVDGSSSVQDHVSP